MPAQSIEELGGLQREALEALWDLREGSVHAVRARLAPRRELAYTTVLSVLQKLEKAGWVAHRSAGKSYVYLPLQQRPAARLSSLRKLVADVFGGDAMLVCQHLVQDGALSDAELLELRRLIEKRRGGSDGNR
jgi:predicted transcriptional regulator